MTKKQIKKYFHLTTPANRANIQLLGIKANEDGHIFLFENLSILNKSNGKTIKVADHIAANQLFIDEFIIFEIRQKGIKGRIESDNVAELTAHCQWILNQPKIDSSHIKFYGRYKTDHESLKNF